MSANFSPDLKDYEDMPPFKGWYKKVLPGLFDDELSYAELVRKAMTYFKTALDNLDIAEENITAIKEAFDALETYVNSYLDNLDFTDTVTSVLDTMASNGTLSKLMANLVPTTAKVVTSTSQMTDSNAIYVYNGYLYAYSEDGFYNTGQTLVDVNAFTFNTVSYNVETLAEFTEPGVYYIYSSYRDSITDTPNYELGEQPYYVFNIGISSTSSITRTQICRTSYDVYIRNIGASSVTPWFSLTGRTRTASSTYTSNYENLSDMTGVEMLLSGGISGYNDSPIIYGSTAGRLKTYFTNNSIPYLQTFESSRHRLRRTSNASSSDLTWGGWIDDNFFSRYRVRLESGTDFDDVTQPGTYTTQTNTIASSCLNCPSTYSGLLVVTYRTDNGTLIQFYIATYDIYYRSQISSGWNSWIHLNSESGGGNLRMIQPATEKQRNIISNATCELFAGYVPLFDMLWATKGTSTYITAGQAYKGTNYSSCHKWDGITMHYVPLQRWYSSICDPNGEMYSEDYLQNPANNTSTCYGSVCSSFVAGAYGFKPDYTTGYMADRILTRKSRHDVSVLEPGDVICTTDHCQMVYAIYVDYYNKVEYVMIAESHLNHESPGIRLTMYDAETIKSLIDMEDADDFPTGIFYYDGDVDLVPETMGHINYRSYDNISLPLGEYLNVSAGDSIKVTGYDSSLDVLYCFNESGSVYKVTDVSGLSSTAGNNDTTVYTYTVPTTPGYYTLAFGTDSSVPEVKVGVSIRVYSVSCSSDAETYSENSTVTVTFSADDGCDGVARWVEVENPHSLTISDIHEFTDDEVSAGTCSFTFNAIHPGYSYYVCSVLYDTPYGVLRIRCFDDSVLYL